MVIFSKKLSICFIILLISFISLGCTKSSDKSFIKAESKYDKFLEKNQLQDKADYVLNKDYQK